MQAKDNVVFGLTDLKSSELGFKCKECEEVMLYWEFKGKDKMQIKMHLTRTLRMLKI